VARRSIKQERWERRGENEEPQFTKSKKQEESEKKLQGLNFSIFSALNAHQLSPSPHQTNAQSEDPTWFLFRWQVEVAWRGVALE